MRHEVSFHSAQSVSSSLSWLQVSWLDEDKLGKKNQSSPQFFSKPLSKKFTHILTFVLKFGVSNCIPNTLGEINRNFAWKLENVVTTLSKTINNNNIYVSTICSDYFYTRYKFPGFSLWMKLHLWKLTLSASFSRLIFQNFHVRDL